MQHGGGGDGGGSRVAAGGPAPRLREARVRELEERECSAQLALAEEPRFEKEAFGAKERGKDNVGAGLGHLVVATQRGGARSEAGQREV